MGIIVDKERIGKFALKKLVVYGIAILIIYSHSIYSYTENETMDNVLKAILSFLPVLLLANVITVPRKMRMFFWCLFYFGLNILFFYLNVNASESVSYACRFIIYVPIMVIYFISNKLDTSIFKAISDLIIIISIIALFFWLFGSTLKMISPTGSMYTTWGRVNRSSYLGIYFEIPVSALGIGLYRNVAIFGEAPAYCFFLCACWLYEEFMNEKSNMYRKGILLLSICTTISTTGFLIIFYGLFIKLAEYMKTHRKFMKLKWLCLITVAIIILLLFYRLMMGEGKTMSLGIRQNDYINGIKAWMTSPLYGLGYQVDTQIYNTGFSNSISLVLLNGGIIWALVYFTPLVSIVYWGYKNKELIVYWGIGICILFSISIVGYTYYILTILAFGYSMVMTKGRMK